MAFEKVNPRIWSVWAILAMSAAGLMPATVSWAAEEILEPQDTEQSAPPAAETAPTPTPATADVPEGPAHPPINPPTHVLPSKIKPVQAENAADEDSLNKAAPDIQDASPPSVNLDQMTLGSTTELDMSSHPYWQDLSNEEVKDVLSKLDLSKSKSKTLHEIAVGMVGNLTSSSEDDDSSGDIYSLRLTRLLELGEIDRALDLYKKNEGSPPSSDAAKAGIVAMFAKGEIGLACLEQKALSPDTLSKDQNFWAKVDLFCKGLLSPAAGDDDALRFKNAARIYTTAQSLKKPTTTKEINQLDSLSLLVMAETGLLTEALKSPESIQGLENLPLALLIERGPQDPALHLQFFAEGLRRGLLEARDSNDLLSAYLESQKLEKPEDVSNKYIAFLTKYLSEQTPLPSPSLIEECTALMGNIDLLEGSFASPTTGDQEAIIPPEWLTLSPKAMKSLLALWARTNHPLPAAMVSKLFPPQKSGDSPQEIKQSTGENILFNEFLSAETKANSPGKPEILAIQAFFSDEAKSKTFKNGIYDNIFNLTESGNYVMPSGDILSSLKRTAGKKPSAQVVIESLNILAAQPIEKLNPAVLYEILTSLDSAGLSVQTKSLGREVLGNILEN